MSRPTLNLRIVGRLSGAYSRSFQTRLLAYLIAFSCVVSVGAGYIYYSRQVKFVEADQARRGNTLISNLAGQSELGAYSGNQSFLLAPVRRAYLERDVNFAAIYTISGKPLIKMVKIGTQVDQHLPQHQLQQLRLSPAGKPLRVRHPDYDDLLAPIVTVHGDVEQSLFGTTGSPPNLSTIGVARLGLSHRPAQQKLDELLQWGVVLALVVLALGVLLALMLARLLSRPIMALAQGADEISSGNLGFQVELNRTDELGLLAESFNRMSAGLRDTVESLADLNRNLEQEVANRTAEVRESRDFVELLNAPLQLQNLLDTALAALMTHAGSRSGAVYLASGGDLVLSASHGALTPASGSALVTPGFMANAVVSPRPVVLDQLPPDLPEEHADLAALALLPVYYQEELQAVVVLGLPGAPPEDQLAFLEHAASQLAIAVANARAFAAVKRLARELERRNLALLSQRDQLQHTARLKGEFLANVSHELRTPLNAILGYSELLVEAVFGEVNDEQRQSLQGILDSGETLLELINHILDLSKVETGHLEVNPQEVELIQLVRDVVESTAPLTRDRPYDVTVELPRTPMPVRSDPRLVRQILVNLLGNAIKFTNQGSVEVSVRQTDDGDALVAVRDTGPGIRPEHLEFIFDAFRQVDGSSTRQHGGTGLGLAISKQLAALLGADVRVQSTYGAGSTFTLELTKATMGGGTAASEAATGERDGGQRA